MYERYLKRCIDFLLSSVGIILLLPILIIISFTIFIDDPGPIIFKQRRIGKNIEGEKNFFQIYKFRTMKMNAPKDTPTHLLKDPSIYITRIGAFLRKTSIDELPQIFNIWKGDMSAIGPRPALWNQDDLYAEREKYGANDIRPGLTGLAQINGRDELEIIAKAKLDGYYRKKMCLWLDIKCFFLTIFSVIKHDGVVEGSQDNR